MFIFDPNHEINFVSPTPQECLTLQLNRNSLQSAGSERDLIIDYHHKLWITLVELVLSWN